MDKTHLLEHRTICKNSSQKQPAKLFGKVYFSKATVRACNFTEGDVHYGCPPGNFDTFFRTPLGDWFWTINLEKETC